MEYSRPGTTSILNQSAAEHYLVDPLGDSSATTLSPDEKDRILGGEPTMWTDTVSDENLDNRVWPRTAAIAERLWSPREVRDLDSMYRRLAIVSHKLDDYGCVIISLPRRCWSE